MSQSADATHRRLKRLTNRRQASKILDIRSGVALHIEDHGRDVWVTGTDAGLYAIGYGAGGGLYMARTLPAGTVQAIADGADSVEVEQEPVPAALWRGPGGGSS